MSERSGKSIFAHKQTYSRKGNSKSRSVSDIADEAERLDGACPHVENPQPPTILEGIRPSEVVALIEQRIAEQNKLLRQLRKEQPDRKDALRTIRSDTHVMIASVFSFPDPVEEMDQAEYLRWRKDVIAFARDDAARNRAEVMSIVEHLDETHPHVHVLAVPICADDNMRMDAKRCHEGHREQDRHKDHGWSGSPSRSYKQAMRGWQDRYHAAVGAKHGQARTGPRRRRLDRAAWKAEQERLKAQKEAEIAILRAEEARRLADEEERRRDLIMQDTVASRLQEAETVHAIATGGLIAAIRQVDPDPVLLERLETPGQMGNWTNHDADRNREMSLALAPVLSDGLEALRQPPTGAGFLEGLSGFLRGVAGWVNRLADAGPRWLKWPETVAYVAQGAKQAFGTTYTASTLAEVIEASPVWQSFTGEARARLDQARAVQALAHPRDSRPDASSQRGI
ncbi:plasmid recombination protein [Paracoccus denitrificans]|uniref:plasmid recombination protein n=1 Tax=Paracoccus denitrificans TaxID=266 RepID=UPI001E31CB7E|nr:plasmid recombination protein [Paracoccus denitrificans]UFS65703.1 plasmid recombination protein [Paracoccus denitrificans]